MIIRTRHGQRIIENDTETIEIEQQGCDIISDFRRNPLNRIFDEIDNNAKVLKEKLLRDRKLMKDSPQIRTYV